ncbi:MAG: DUF4984 domain-containing protein [Candidatus Cryptobacteroides sp.]
MKKHTIIAIAMLMAVLSSCESTRQIYEGPSYIAFADTLTVVPVLDNSTSYPVTIAATRTSAIDRVVGVEIVQGKETTAVEGRDFEVEDFNVVIPAGQLSASFMVKGLYDGIEDPDKDLTIRLKLAFIEEGQDKIYDEIFHSETKVALKKIAPFDLECQFTGYAVMSSGFISSFNPYGAQKRLVRASLVPGKTNTVSLEDLFSDGYDVEITFDPSDPLNPYAQLEEGAPIGKGVDFSFVPLGDGLVRVADYAALNSYFDTNNRRVSLYNIMYIRGAGQNGTDGLIGAYNSVLYWISDAEAEFILNNGF